MSTKLVMPAWAGQLVPEKLADLNTALTGSMMQRSAFGQKYRWASRIKEYEEYIPEVSPHLVGAASRPTGPKGHAPSCWPQHQQSVEVLKEGRDGSEEKLSGSEGETSSSYSTPTDVHPHSEGTLFEESVHCLVTLCYSTKRGLKTASLPVEVRAHLSTTYDKFLGDIKKNEQWLACQIDWAPFAGAKMRIHTMYWHYPDCDVANESIFKDIIASIIPIEEVKVEARVIFGK